MPTPACMRIRPCPDDGFDLHADMTDCCLLHKPATSAGDSSKNIQNSPLDGGRGLAGDVVADAVDGADLHIMTHVCHAHH